MYNYPYGNTSQLNLDWILAKLKELEAGGSGGGADLEEVSNALISLTYNNSTAYRRYDYAFRNGKLYRCLSDTTGAFDPAAWQEALIGDDLAVLTRWINAIDAAAVVDVKFDTSGTNGKIQQKYHDQYHDVVEVDYTPVQNSKRPLSSNAGYELNGAITSLGNANQYIIKQAGTYTTNGLVLAGYTTGSGNYFDFYIPISISSERTISSCSLKLTTVKLFLPDGVVNSAINTSTLNVMSRNDFGFMCEATLAATQTANRAASLLCAGITLVIT